MTTDTTAPAAPAPTISAASEALQILEAAKLDDWEIHYLIGVLAYEAPAALIAAVANTVEARA